jgi:hypothetical protein
MAQPPPTENDAPQRVSLRVEQWPELDDKVLQSLQDDEMLNLPPADIKAPVAQSILLTILDCAGINFEEAVRPALIPWDDAEQGLNIIRQCVATKKFHPALGSLLDIHRWRSVLMPL